MNDLAANEDKEETSDSPKVIKRKLILSFCKITLTLVLLVLLVGCGGLYMFQRKMMYFPRPYELEYGDKIGSWNLQPVRFETNQGVQNSFSFYQDTAESENTEEDIKPKVWVCFHGNASLALDWAVVHFQDFQQEQDVRFLLVDYPGYGLSEGSPTRKGIIENGQEALSAYLTEKDLSLEDVRIGVVGYSMGAAAGLEFASRQEVEDVILFAPFTSIMDMAKRTVPWPFYHVAVDRYNNAERIEELLAREKPPSITIYHGLQDNIIPVTMGRELHQISPEEIEFLELDYTGHQDIVQKVQDKFFEKLNQ